MKISYLIFGHPDQQEAAHAALRSARDAQASGAEILCAFFYSDAVETARLGARPELADEWAALAQSMGAQLIACSSSAVRRGVLDDRGAAPLAQTPTLHDGFELAGLGQLAEAILISDQLAVFGRQGTQDQKSPEPGTAQSTSGSPLVVITQDANNEMLTLESLDLVMALAAFLPETALLFRGDGATLLAPGERPASKRVRALPEYGLTRCHVSRSDLEAVQLFAGSLCIPCQIDEDAAIEELIHSHRPVITL